MQVSDFYLLQVLFVEGRCFEMHGYTKHCLQVLNGGTLQLFYRGRARTVGAGGLQNSKKRALQRMRRVVEVCEQAVRSEFPSFDVILAFKMFSLREFGGTSSSTTFMADVAAGTRRTEGPRESAERLALLFGVPLDAFLPQFERLRAVAAVHLKATSCCNREAWQFAWRRCKMQWKVSALEPVRCSMCFETCFLIQGSFLKHDASIMMCSA